MPLDDLKSASMKALKHPKFPMIAGASAVAFLGIGFYSSPYLAMNSMKGALERGDSQEIAQNVDFPAVRSSLKSEMRALVARQAKSDPASGLGSLLASSLIDPTVDQFVTPEGVKALI
jgi:Protein of unknown function (DUF2939)